MALLPIVQPDRVMVTSTPAFSVDVVVVRTMEESLGSAVDSDAPDETVPLGVGLAAKKLVG